MKYFYFNLTVIGLWLSFGGFLLALFIYMNKRGHSKKGVVKKSLLYSTIIALLIWITGTVLIIIIDDEERLADIIVEKLQRHMSEKNISDLPRPSLEEQSRQELPSEIREMLKHLDIIERAGISIDPQTYFKEGRLYYEDQEYTKAIEKLNIAIKINSSFGKAHYLLGCTYIITGQYDDAIRENELALELAENNIQLEGDSLNNLGLIYRHKGNLDKSLEYSKKALKLFQNKDNVGESSALDNIGIVYLMKNDLPNAKQALEKALSLDRITGRKRDETTALINLGLCYMKAEAPDHAFKYFQDSFKIADKNNYYSEKASALLNMGAVYYNRKMMDKAEEYYKHILEIPIIDDLKELKANALNNLGNVYQYNQDFQASIDAYLKSLDIYRAVSSVVFTGAKLNHKSSNEWLSVENNQINPLINIGYSFSKLNKLEDAITYTKQILKIDSTYAIAYYNLGCYYSLLGDIDQAIVYLEQGKKFFSDQVIAQSQKDSDLKNVRNDPRFKSIMTIN